MSWIDTHRHLARGETRGAEGVLGCALVPLSALFGAGVAVRTWAYNWRLLPVHRLGAGWTVISVGALAAGGTGKTPFAAYLARRLRAAGLRPLLVSQGYGAPQRDRGARLISPGRMARGLAEGWETAGEEAVLLARLAPEVPVAVAARYEDAATVVGGMELAPRLLVMDGGFQHRHLHQDVRFVLLDAASHPAGAHLLPRGDLREPWGALRRASWIVLSRAELCPDRSAWEELIARRAPERPHFWCENRIGAPHLLSATQPAESQIWADLIGKRLGIWTALGHPEAFVRGLDRLGIRPVWQHYARDHAPFGRREVDELVRVAREKRLCAFLVTRKDAVKMEAYADRLPPVLVVPAEVVPDEEGAVALDEFVGSMARAPGAVPADAPTSEAR